MPSALVGSTAVVIDVLRATTTIIAALAAGARAVVPCLTVEDARRRAHDFGDRAVLAGERSGLRIEGFDLGNSPSEFTPSAVGGRMVVMTTTNGTKALLHVAQASEILIGAFVNLSAVCSQLAGKQQIDIVCAGTDDAVTEEDVLAAGAIARRMVLADAYQVNDAGTIAVGTWAHFAGCSHPLADEFRLSAGGRNLLSIGMNADIECAAEIDRFDLVPRFDAATGEVRLK